MARSGRFGSLPGSSPDLTATIVALLEQYESARDRNIMSAWMNGGKFEGKKVTDEHIKNWFKMRRSQFTKDDPEYDYWNQQYEQVDYQIGESKMLLSFEQGKIKESAAAQWYTQSASRFPKNSEAWREAMRNAARFKKAAQEKAKAARSVSKSEQYQNEQDRIYRTRIAPAEEAQRIWEQALKANNVDGGSEGFMGLGYEGMMTDNEGDVADGNMRAFMRTKAGKEYADRYRKLTGEKFTYKSFRRMLNRAEQGYNQMAGVATKYGYQSYVPGFRDSARNVGAYTTNLNVYTDDIYDRYDSINERYKREMDEATTAAERREIARQYSGKFEKVARAAQKRGDHQLAGDIRRRGRSIVGKGSTGGNRLEDGGGASGDEITRDITYQTQTVDGREVQTSAVDTTGMTQVEIDIQQALLDEEIIEGFKDGSWVMLQTPDGRMVEQRVEAIESQFDFTPGLGLRANGFVYNTSTVRVNGEDIPVKTYIELKPVTFIANGQKYPTGAYTYQTIDGETRYQYPGPDGKLQDTGVPPFDFASQYDDGLENTAPGHVWDEKTKRQVSVITEPDRDGNVRISGAAYDQFAAAAEADWAAQNPGENGVVPPMTDAFLNQAIAGYLSGATPRNEQGYIDRGGDIVETVQVERPEYRERTAPKVTSNSLPHAIDFIAGGRQRYENMSAEDQATVRAQATALQQGGDLPPEVQDIVNERVADGFEWEGGNFVFEGDTVSATVNTDTFQPAVEQSLQGPSEEDITALMEQNGGEQYLADRNIIESGDYGEGDPEYDQALERQNNLRKQATGIAESNVQSGVQATGNVYEGDQPGETIDPADIKVETQPRIDTGLSPVVERFEDKVLILPAVLTEAASTMNTTGNYGQYMSKEGRERLSRMTPEARFELAGQLAVEDAGKDSNPALVYAYAGELDILAAAGENGISEIEFYTLTGSLSTTEKTKKANEARRLRTQAGAVTSQDVAEDSLLNDLRTAGWSDEQLKTDFPDLYKEETQRASLKEQAKWDPGAGGVVIGGRDMYGNRVDPAAPTAPPAPPTIASAMSTLVNASKAAQAAAYGIDQPSVAPPPPDIKTALKSLPPMTTATVKQPDLSTPDAASPTWNGASATTQAERPSWQTPAATSSPAPTATTSASASQQSGSTSTKPAYQWNKYGW